MPQQGMNATMSVYGSAAGIGDWTCASSDSDVSTCQNVESAMNGPRHAVRKRCHVAPRSNDDCWSLSPGVPKRTIHQASSIKKKRLGSLPLTGSWLARVQNWHPPRRRRQTSLCRQYRCRYCRQPRCRQHLRRPRRPSPHRSAPQTSRCKRLPTLPQTQSQPGNGGIEKRPSQPSFRAQPWRVINVCNACCQTDSFER